MDYDDHETAELAKTSYIPEEGDGVASIRVEGKTLIITYEPEAYEGTTLEEIKASYELLQAIQEL